MDTIEVKDELEANEHYKLSFFDNCRVCLDLHEDTTSIEILKQSSEMNSLLTYFSIEVMDDDRYPSGICLPCVDQLNNIVSFKQKCESTFNYLTNILQDSYNESEYIGEDGNEYVIQYLDSENEISSATYDDKNINEITEMSDDYQKNFESELCDDSSTSPASKYQMKPFSCSMCWKRFTRRCKLREHEKKFHGEVPHPSSNIIRPFVCTLCSAAFTRRFTLNIHKRKHHGEESTSTLEFKGLKPFSCSVCFTAFTQKNALNEHKKKFHGINDTSFGAPAPLQRNLKPFACSDCSMTFTREYILNRHKQKYHDNKDITIVDENPQKPFVCHICYTAFSRGDTLNEHKRKYHNDSTIISDDLQSKEKKFICKVCSRTFSREVMLTKHQEKYHSENHLSIIDDDQNYSTFEINKPFFCSACSKAFTQQIQLMEHIQKCHENNPPPDLCDDLIQVKTDDDSPFEFECKYCTQSFPCKMTLLTHINNVHENREYSFDLLCALCGEVFCSKYDLTNHNKLFHSDLRNYQCSYCHRRFKNFENCRRHENSIHLLPIVTTPSREKTFTCDLCPRTFSQKPTLDVHKKLVHGQLKKY